MKQVASDLKDNLDREVKKNDTLEKFGRSMSELGENIKETTLDISERVGNEVQKATSKLTGTDEDNDAASRASTSSRERENNDTDGGSRRMIGSMPPGCFCDMRGYACPLHRGKEAWRFSHDFQVHVRHNVDPQNASEKAVGLTGGDAAVISEVVNAAYEAGAQAEREPRASSQVALRQPAPSGGGGVGAASNQSEDGQREQLDEIMAQLVGMGFDPERVAKALERHPNLEAATHALLDDPSAVEPSAPSPPPRVPSDVFLGGPPDAPPPPPPTSAKTTPSMAGEPSLLGDLAFTEPPALPVLTGGRAHHPPHDRGSLAAPERLG